MKDREILDKITAGDESALDFLYKKYFKMMARLVMTNNGTEQDAKDIFQDALIVFWQKVKSGKLILTSKISTYLYSICLNLWRKELERKKRLSREEKDGTSYINDDQAERIKIVNECIGMLGETCKNVLTFYYFENMSMQDIADKLNFANTDTAKTKKYKCKKKLDKLMKERYTAADFLD